MHENGGCAFLVVLAIVYLTFGIPTYLLETLLGQYSGKKPIIMIRLMMPIFSGKLVPPPWKVFQLSNYLAT